MRFDVLVYFWRPIADVLPTASVTTHSPQQNTAVSNSNANALQLGGRPTSRQSFWAVLVNFVLRLRTNCYFLASDKNSDIVTRLSDPDFSEGSNNFAIGRRFHVVTFTVDI